MRKLLVGTIAVVGSFIFTLAMYGRLDERVPIHWNLQFEVDNYAPRAITLVIAFALLGLPILAIALSRTDPRGGERNRDPSTYWTIWSAVMCLLATVQFQIVASGAGWDVPAARFFPMLLGIFFVIVGNLEPRLRPNWYVGTRTPWTMSSDEVWRRTHRVGGRASVAGGLLFIVGTWLPFEPLRLSAWTLGLVLVIVVPIAYSYVIWRRLGRPRPTMS